MAAGRSKGDLMMSRDGSRPVLRRAVRSGPSYCKGTGRLVRQGDPDFAHDPQPGGRVSDRRWVVHRLQAGTSRIFPVIDGFGKILTVWRKPRAVRIPTLVNGLVDLSCAALLWYLNQIIGTERAIGIVVGAYIAAAGWRMLMAPVEDATPAAAGAL